MKVRFKNVESTKIQESFMEVVESYEDLQDCQITLAQQIIKSSTMQAQPIISLLRPFGQTNRYRVKLAYFVRDSEELRVDELPKKVLVGWFAHELGHVLDYRSRGNFRMMLYGLKYLISNKFKRTAEHEADYNAIKNGFRDEIIRTKRFILDNHLLGEGYKTKIKRYYLSVEDAAVWQHPHVPGTPDAEL